MLDAYRQFVVHKAAPARPISGDLFHLVHASMGLSTEYLEALIAHPNEPKELHEELGDFAWFLMLAAEAIGYPVHTLPMKPFVDKLSDTVEKDFASMLELFLSVVKREVCYDNHNGITLERAYYGLWLSYIAMLAKLELELEDIIEANKEKLNRRYQDSFSQEEAEQRKDKE